MYRLGSEESYTRRSISRIHAALRRGSSARVVGDFAIGRAFRLGTGEILPLLQPSVLARPPNALTLSCKSRLPRRPQESGAAAAATNTKWRERTAAGVPRACSSEPPKAASPPSQGSAVFVSL